MAVLIRLILALVLGNSAIFGLEFMDDSFHYSMYLDPAETYQLFWKYDETDITFKVKVETTGYVGFGLSTNGGMKGADIVIGGVQSGKTYFSDRHATGNTKPEKDPEQNWKLLFAEEDDTSTVLVFTRPLRSCDTENDLDIKRETQRVIWAYGPLDQGADDAISYHRTSRGSRSVYLMVDQPTPVSLGDDVLHFDVRAPLFTLPSKATTYWRTAYKLPELPQKHHMIGMEPLIRDIDKGIVHHIILYDCSSTEIDETMHGKSYDLFEEPKMMASCEAITFGWAIGGGPFYLPENVGMPLGGAAVKNKFVLLEIHYDNPQQLSNIQDDSGLRILYTPNLREQEAGVLMTGRGVSGNHVIPPFAESFRTSGYCPSGCTQKALASQPEGIHVIAGTLHSHLLGRKLRIRHIRNGTELPPIMTDENYDFNYQEIRPFSEEVTILPGDDLLMECDYGTVHKKKITRGGLGTDEEMCLVFLMYYPLGDFQACVSYVPIEQTLSFIEDIEVSGRKITGPKQFANSTLLDVLNTIDWKDSKNRDKLEKSSGEGRMGTFCRIGYQGESLPEQDTPEILVPFVKPLELCNVGEQMNEQLQLQQEPAPFSPQDFQHYTELDGENVVLFWSYDEDTIKFLVKAKTSGWVGFGLSPDGKMANSDVVIGYRKDDSVHISDRFIKHVPIEDNIQNWGAASVVESDGFTYLTFERPLVSCDPMDRNVTEGNLHLIWAYGDNDPDQSTLIQMHSNRGSKLVRLINGPLNPFVAMENSESMTTMEDGTVQIEIRNPNVPITTMDSTYYDTGLKFPELKEKYHIVKVEPLIQPGNEDFIYNIALYGCPNEVPDSFHGRAFDIRKEIVVEIFQCSTYMGAWTIGTGAFEYPSEYGFPVGGPDRPIKFVRISTLFSNDAGFTGLRDSSGLRLTLVPATRKQDIGYLRVGHSAIFGGSHIIPGGVKDFLVRGHCMADCLGEGLQDNPNGITVTGVNLYSHRNTTSMVLRHIRNGREMRPIVKDPHFHFHNQEMVVLQEPVQIRPGDKLVIDCHLNTTGATQILTAGAQANSQPCLASLMYYPPIDLGICESASPPTEFLKVFDKFRFTGSPWYPQIESPPEWKGKGFYETFATMDISKEEIKRALQSQMTATNVSSFCFKRDEAPTLPPNQTVRIPLGFELHSEPVHPCPEQAWRGSTRPTWFYTTPRRPVDRPADRPADRPGDASGSDVISSNALIVCLCVMFLTLVRSQQ